jgi:glycosyltransferase involved in cell wall biosynthesis
MHVAICSDGVFPEAIGGMQRHTRLLVETMARCHPEMHLTVIHTHPGCELFQGLSNVAEVAVAPRDVKQQYLIECFKLAARFEAVLRQMPQAIVYSQGICVLKEIREFSHRLVVNPHGLESFQSLTLRDWVASTPFRVVQKRTLRHARHLISLGGRLTGILERESGRIPGKVVVIPNGVIVPPDAPRPEQGPDAPLNLLFVGRLATNKGVPDLLGAMDELRRRGVGARFRLDVVGGGPLLEQLSGANTRTNVRFLDKVSDEQLEQLYLGASALVLPTLFEGMPTVVLEAMARGIPALVTDVGASRELVDSSNGEIIAKRDPAALADALMRLDQMGTSGRRMLGEAGRRRALERFTWERVADGHAELFRRLHAQLGGN